MEFNNCLNSLPSLHFVHTHPCRWFLRLMPDFLYQNVRTEAPENVISVNTLHGSYTIIQDPIIWVSSFLFYFSLHFPIPFSLTLLPTLPSFKEIFFFCIKSCLATTCIQHFVLCPSVSSYNKCYTNISSLALLSHLISWISFEKLPVGRIELTNKPCSPMKMYYQKKILHP